MRQPRVSIGVPVFNGERYLERTLDSLLSQSFEDFELIISDNASTDLTEEICRAYAKRDGRIRYDRCAANAGAAANLNRLPALASGDYFKWAMADDLCGADLLSRCVAVLNERRNVVLVCTRTAYIDEQDNVVKEIPASWDVASDDARERFRRAIYVGGHWANADSLAGVIRRQPLLNTRLFPRYQGGDKRPLAELSLVGKFVELPEFLQFRRMHPESSGVNNPEFSKDSEKAIRWMMTFFNGSRGEVSRPTWQLLRDHAKTVHRSNLPIVHRIQMYAAIGKLARWNWRRLALEVRLSLRTLLASSKADSTAR